MISSGNFHHRHFLLPFVKLKCATRFQSVNRCFPSQEACLGHKGFPCAEGGSSNTNTMLHASCNHVPASSGNRAMVEYCLPVGKDVRPPSSGGTQCIFATTMR